jgi:hypothetical protein
MLQQSHPPSHAKATRHSTVKRRNEVELEAQQAPRLNPCGYVSKRHTHMDMNNYTHRDRIRIRSLRAERQLTKCDRSVSNLIQLTRSRTTLLCLTLPCVSWSSPATVMVSAGVGELRRCQTWAPSRFDTQRPSCRRVIIRSWSVQHTSQRLSCQSPCASSLDALPRRVLLTSSLTVPSLVEHSSLQRSTSGRQRATRQVR